MHEKLAFVTIHDEIKRLRKAAKLSQDELAARVSALQPEVPAITRQTVAHWEKGSTAPKRARLNAVADVLKTTVEALLNGGEPAQTEPHPLQKTLEDWRLQASSRSQQVIDNLVLLAGKNELRDEDWQLIEQLAARFRRK